MEWNERNWFPKQEVILGDECHLQQCSGGQHKFSRLCLEVEPKKQGKKKFWISLLQSSVVRTLML